MKNQKGITSTNWQLQNNHGDEMYSIEDIIDNIIISMYGAGWVLDLSKGLFPKLYKYLIIALTGVALLVGHCPARSKVSGLQVGGTYERQPIVSLSFSLPFLLSEDKQIKFLKINKFLTTILHTLS